MATSDPNVLTRLQAARAPKGKKEQKPLAKRSYNLKQEMIPYKKEVALFLAKPENKYCIIRAEGCSTVATAVHHVAGRSGKQLREQKDWKPCCSNCNGHVEVNDAEARANGHKKTRLTKVIK